MTLADFQQKYTGQRLADPWGGYVGECVSLVKRYAVEVLNLPGQSLHCSNGGARDLVEHPNAQNLQYFDVIHNDPNDPNQFPQSGDVMVWNWGTYGHTGVVVSATQGGFTCFEQNNPVGTGAHTVVHNWNGVIGWLRQKGTEPMFNEGDRVNVNNSLFGEDKGWYKEYVGKKTYKEALEAILGSPQFYGESRVNDGDLVNIANATGWPSEPNVKGWLWKRFWYDYADNKIGAETQYAPVTEQLYRKK